MAIILSYLFYFIASSSSSLQRRWLATSKDKSWKEQTHFAFDVVLILFIGSFLLPIFSPLYFEGNTLKIILLTLICGLFGMGYFIFNYIAQKYVDASITTVVSNIYTPVTIILSFILLKEGLSIQQIIGTCLLLMSLFIISKKHRIGKFRFDKYFLMMLLSGILLGVLLVAERSLQKTTGLSASTILSWGSQCFFLGIATLISNSRHTYTKKEVFVTGALKLLQGLSYVTLVFVVGNLSLVSSVTTFKVVIVFISAVIFLNEREHLKRKIIGSFIALAGLLLM
ncbi:MAG: DMT family transporter [Candidatus Pacebacteria bacterium]|nr:DMT family transporter [Candidatus Paceibacterota bacterium]